MIAAHADWSVDASKRWMAIARPHGKSWVASIRPVGPVSTLLSRLQSEAFGGPVALGVDFPIGLPRAFAALHAGPSQDFPAFLRGLAARPMFFDVAATLEAITPSSPFYPRRGIRGMTRVSHALALGLSSAADLGRACDRATQDRPAGAPLFWTLGANQTGKAALAAWRDMLLPALADGLPLKIWPFDGPFRTLLAPGGIAIAETYPADALRQLGLRPIGSKRRQPDRAALVPGIRSAMERLDVVPDPPLQNLLREAFGADAAGEDRMDCMLGVLCVLQVLAGHRPDAAPADPWIGRWEGWVLGQSWSDAQP